MARLTNRLTARFCRTVSKPGRYPDGSGLYLDVKPSGSRSWIYRFRLNKQAHDMGLGPYAEVSLAEARERALEHRKQRRAGNNPIELRRQNRRRHVPSRSFKDCATEYWNTHKDGWRNATHVGDWIKSVTTHAFPEIGGMLVSDIDTPAVLRVLSPIWKEKHVTAKRVRGRIENVLDFATTRGWREGDNPARWDGHLEHQLPKRVARVKHHAALPYADAPAFMTRLRAEQGVDALALEFLIRNVNRTDEVLRAKYQEFDPKASTWLIPGERMKGGRDHRVPLSAASVAVLDALQADCIGDYVFPGTSGDGWLHKHAMLQLLNRLSPEVKVTVHGLRCTFMDWSAEQTNFPKEARDLALAHKVSDAVEAAYRRGDMFERRRALAEAWSRYLDSTPGDVITFPERAVIG
jgi:integrase